MDLRGKRIEEGYTNLVTVEGDSVANSGKLQNGQGTDLGNVAVGGLSFNNPDSELQLPAGTTAERPSSPSAGYARFNTDKGKVEIYTGTSWLPIALEGAVELEAATATVTGQDSVAVLLSFFSQFGTPASAFSVRQLGDSDLAMRVRRSSDNAEQNIGFDSNGDLDETALTTFVGANDGFVTTWYDQSIDNTTLPADYGSGATASYSLRKVVNSYTGNAIRVRRASDNTEQDIGFSNGELDTSSLETFCSGTNGFVTTWYDQSGSNNATQSTAGSQPQIVSSGSTILENGKPALDFDGSDDYLDTSNDVTINQIHTVFKSGITSSSSIEFLVGDVANYTELIALGSFTGTLSGETFTYRDSSNNLIATSESTIINNHVLVTLNATDDEIYANGSLGSMLATAGGTTLMKVRIGTRSSADFTFGGVMQEFIVYETDQSANRESIELNQASYYDIGVSLGASQSTAGSQPKIVSSGTVIKENSVPAIEMDGTNHMDTSFKVNGDGDVTFFIVATPTGNDDPANLHSLLGETENTNDSYGYILFYDTSDADQNFSYGHYQNVISDYDQVDSSQKIRGTQYLITTIRDVDSDHELFIDGVSQGTTTTNATSDSTNNLRIGDDHRVETDRRFEGTFNEIIFFRADKSADRTSIESNIATYFNITI